MKSRYKRSSNMRFRNRSNSNRLLRERSAYNSRNFSDIEDSIIAYSVIHTLAADAGHNAAAEAKALGIARVYVKNNELIKISGKGDTSIVEPKVKRQSFYVTYKPSTILHAVNK